MKKTKSENQQTIKVNKALNKFEEKILFPNKLSKANKMLREVGLPKAILS